MVVQAAVARVTSAGFDGMELLDPPPAWPLVPGAGAGAPVHVAVLDSSFNPPTRAHCALASAAFPPPVAPAPSTGLAAAAAAATSAPSAVADPGPYTARLLLFSARNADKRLGPGDAHPAQRAEMMLAQARAMQAAADERTGPVAVGLVSAATFVAKAETLTRALAPRSGGAAAPALSFVVGADTLVRIFDPKYYAPGGMGEALETLFSRSWLVCVRRGDDPASRAEEDALFAHPAVAAWIARGKVRVLPPVEGCEDVSSTRVRASVCAGASAADLAPLCLDPVGRYIVQEGLYREE